MIPFAVDMVLCPSPPRCWLTTNFVSESEDVTSSILLHVYSSIEEVFNFFTTNDLLADVLEFRNITKVLERSTKNIRTSNNIFLLSFTSFACNVLSN